MINKKSCGLHFPDKKPPRGKFVGVLPEYNSFLTKADVWMINKSLLYYIDKFGIHGPAIPDSFSLRDKKYLKAMCFEMEEE